MDVEILSRIQFAFTISIHYIFPPLTIGLGLILVFIEAAYLKTRNPLYEQMARFWTRIFGLIFALGVATGIVMEFEFGTNWATYSRYVGDVFGSALAAEGIFAFFLESGFLALLLFGWNKVGPKLHFFATCMVCFGSHFSAVWIVVANSWMQTPAGYHIVGEGLKARAQIVDFWAMVFNPSSVDRLTHVILGCWLAGAFLVTSVSAYYLLRRRHIEFAKSSFKFGLVLAVIASLLQLVSGDSTAKGVYKNQPAKFAALEGVFKTEPYSPLYLAGWVDVENEKVYGIGVPGALSFLTHMDFKEPVVGYDQIDPKWGRPKIQAVFQAYHIMIAVGMALIGLSVLGVFLWWRGCLFHGENQWIRYYWGLMVVAVLGPQIANQAGWYTAELGRQPWIVYGMLKTSDALSKAVKAEHVLTSLIMFLLIYGLLFALFIYLLNDKIQHGPDDHAPEQNEGNSTNLREGHRA
ncbi:MAG: cytochrome ubiquinol oxidase subunit I [Verrucomicrobia bacterium Tous-C9LFEB]|nr:MAG: cytochrome ubiquinol oxidase subunit I [Verrucomicrobia bacterium Tous-C9LFEB]